MLRRADRARTDVSEVRVAFIIRVTRIGELGATLAVTSNRSKARSLIATAVKSSNPTNSMLLKKDTHFI
jgi:hypothetical protein